MRVEEEWEEMRKRIGEEEVEMEEETETEEEGEGEGEEEGEGKMVEVRLVKWDKGWKEEETKVRCGKKAVESPWEGGRKSCANVTEEGEVVMVMKQKGESGEIVGGEFVIAKEYVGVVEKGSETFAELVKSVVNSRKEVGSHGRMLSAYYVFNNMDGFATGGERDQMAKELKNWVTDRFWSEEVMKGEGKVKKEGKRFVYDFFRSGFSLREGDKCMFEGMELEVIEVDYEKCEATVMNEKEEEYVIGLNLLEVKDFVLKKGEEERREALNYFHSTSDEKQGKKNHEAFFYYAFYRHLCKDVKGRRIADFLTRGRREETETPSYLEYVLLSFVRKLFAKLEWGGSEKEMETEQRIKKYIYVVVISALMKSVFNDLNRKYSEYYGVKAKKSIDKLVEELESPKSPNRTPGKGRKRKSPGGGRGNRKRGRNNSLPPTPNKINHNEITRMQTNNDDEEEESFEIITTLTTMKHV
jgi:hypothetical protein